jgi:hypothetical protein
VEVRQWVDSSTAILYAGLEEAVRENLDEAFGAHFLVTLKFDEAGKWKIVKTHRMSDKEVENRDAGEDVSGPPKQLIRRGLVRMRVFARRIDILMKFITRCAPAFPHQRAVN